MASEALFIRFVTHEVRPGGVEPPRLAARDFKSRMSTIFITGARFAHVCHGPTCTGCTVSY